MATLVYQDFNVRFAHFREEGGALKFDVWVEGNPPAGPMRPDDAVTVNWRAEDFWEHPASLFGGPAGGLEELRVEERHLRQLGAMLANLALPAGIVRRLFQESIKLQRQAGEGLRLRLHIDDNPLTRVPWEYLLLPDDPGDPAPTDFLALREEVSIVRTATVETIPWPLPQRNRVHVVGVLSSPRSTGDIKLARLDLEKDRKAVEATAALLNADEQVMDTRWVERPAGSSDLRHALADSDGVDIFHFGGHGRFDERKSEGVLYFERDGLPDPMDANDLAILLRPHNVRLAVLGACDSSVGNSKNVWTGVASALTRQRVPAVIGSQLTVRDNLAAVFFYELYTRLFQGMTIDQAVAAGRIAMMSESGIEARDWGALVLHLHDTSGVLFPMPEPGAVDAAEEPFLQVSQAAQIVLGRIAAAELSRISRGEGDVAAILEDLRKELAAPTRPPYPGPVPFTFDDRHLFFGRTELIEELVDSVDEHPIVLLVGPPACGKTSLIEAGLLPALTAPLPITIRLEDYADVEATLRSRLIHAAASLGLEAPQDQGLRDLVESITEQPRMLLLVLDQFERLFDLTPARQRTAAHAIAATVNGGGRMLRVVAAYGYADQDAVARLAGLQDTIPALMRKTLEVPWLNRAQAKSAILEPARQHRGMVYEPVSLIDRIVDDLDAISRQDPGYLEPLSLQLVCNSLYERARSRAREGGFATVTEDTYDGAEFIVGRYLEDLLGSPSFADVADIARRALHDLTLASPDPWLAADEIDVPATTEKMSTALDRMLAAGLVVRRPSEPFEYRLANPAIRRAAERYSGTTGAGDAARTLDDLWYEWITRKRLADAGQVVHLADAPRLETDLAHSLFLLQSAVDSETDVAPWLERVQAHRGELTTYERDRVAVPMNSSLERLLGAPRQVEDVGAVTAGAVRGDTQVARDTASLALTTVEDYPARVDRGLDSIDGSGLRRRRRAQIWSAIAEGGVALPSPDRFRGTDRLAIWAMRVGRRLRGHRRDVVGIALWGSLLAGLIFGSYQAAAGTLTSVPGGLTFFVNAWIGAVFAAGALVPALVARYGLVRPRWWKTIAAGAVGFGLVNLLFTFAVGNSPANLPIATPLAFIVGVSLVWTVTGDRPSMVRVAIATIIAALVFGLTHGFIEIVGRHREAFQVVRNASFFAAELPLQAEFFEIRSFKFFEVVSAMDAAFAGACLALGIGLGSRVGSRRAAAGERRRG